MSTNPLPYKSTQNAGLFSAAWADTAIPSVSLVADMNALASALALRFDVSKASYVMSGTNAQKVAQSATFAASYAVSGRVNGARIVQSPDVPNSRVGLVADANVLRTINFNLSSPDGSIEVSGNATGHADSAPSADLSTATPARSAFQTQSLHVRMPVFATWGSRYKQGVQHVENAAWA